MTTPIFIIVNNPGLELLTLLENLNKTDIDRNPIVIVDDQSTDDNSKALLYTNKVVDFNGEKTIGISGKYSVISSSKTLGKKYRVLFAVNSAFKVFPNAEMCVVIDGATSFENEWLSELKNLYVKRKPMFRISMLSIFNSAYDETKEDILIDEAIEGKCTAFTKEFYDELKKIGYFSTADLKGIGTSYSLLQKVGHNVGFVTVKSNKNFIK